MSTAGPDGLRGSGPKHHSGVYAPKGFPGCSDPGFDRSPSCCCPCDLPLFIHFRWVTKRLIKGLFVDPPGWPENSPLWSSSMQSYRVLRLCHRRLTPKYRQLVTEEATSKRVHHLRSPAQIESFLDAVKKEPRTQQYVTVPTAERFRLRAHNRVSPGGPVG